MVLDNLSAYVQPLKYSFYGGRLRTMLHVSGYANKLLAVISIPYEIESIFSNRPDKVRPTEIPVELIDLDYRSPDNVPVIVAVRPAPPAGVSSDDNGWRITIDIDRERLADLGWIEHFTHLKDDRMVGFPADSLALNTADLRARHYAVSLNAKIVTAMINASVLEFGFAPERRSEIEPLLKITVDKELRAQIALLSGNCVP